MSRIAWRLRRAAVRLRGERVEIRDLLDAHGPGSQGALLMLLALPCLLPVPGAGTMVGLGIAALAVGMWRDIEAQVLPERVVRQTLPRSWARRLLAMLARVYVMASSLARPRLTAMLAPTMLRAWMPLLVGWMAVLIILPVPFGNVLPALALLLLGAGLVFMDGLLVLVSWAAAGLATAFPVALAVAVTFLAPATVGAW